MTRFERRMNLGTAIGVQRVSLNQLEIENEPN
jgi:hypothetical protein